MFVRAVVDCTEIYIARCQSGYFFFPNFETREIKMILRILAVRIPLPTHIYHGFGIGVKTTSTPSVGFDTVSFSQTGAFSPIFN